MVWTDAIQMVIFCAPLIIIAVLGTHAVGGWSVVWDEAAKGQRLEFFKCVRVHLLPALRSESSCVFHTDSDRVLSLFSRPA